MRKAVAVWLGLAAMAIMVVAGWTEGAEANPVPRALLRHPGLAARVGITDQQMEQIEDIHFTGEKELIDARARIRAECLEIRRALRADKPDMASIRERIGAMERARGDLLGKRIEMGVRMREILSPEQMRQVRQTMRWVAGRHLLRRDGRGMRHDVPGFQGRGMKHLGPAFQARRVRAHYRRC